jgi:hypothetical protein
VWELLGEDEQGMLPSFDRMFELWDDLEKWSVRDMDGKRGLFEARIVGGKIHIGLPLAQAVLTEEERRSLPRVFADAGLQPGSLPSDRELRRALAIYGRSILRARTLTALQHDSANFGSAILDIVSEEFLSWDGELPEPNDQGGLRGVNTGLRLSLLVDRVARTARPTVRCRSEAEFPDPGLLLQGASAGPLYCEEYVPGWSHPLVLASTGVGFVPADREWIDGLVLRDAAAQWTARLRPSPLRIFVDGRPQQLPGLVEVLDLPRGTPFFLAFHDLVETLLEHWAESGCRGWEAIEVAGLPPGWHLASVQEAITDTGPRAVDDRLGFPDRRTLRFVKGIPAAAGSTFFSFAPPIVRLDGALPGDAVTCNGTLLHESEGEPGSYSLPQDLPVDTRIGLEVRHGEDVIRRKSLYLVSGAAWQISSALATIDGFGQRLPDVAEGIAGAVVAPTGELPVDLLRTPGLKSGASRVYFLGKVPGQVAVWPKESLPEWRPVWAIPLRRRGSALFCADGLEEAEPAAGRAGTNAQVLLWRTVFSRWSKRIALPREPALRSLWNRYREVARDA